ncbi:MAG: TonB-dependent receptor [Chitinophagales bacterium]|nr:TonB-dependent receptor [Chitinophagales bacterium]
MATKIYANTISGTILDENNQAVAYANIAVYNTSDSVYVNGTISDSIGQFEITNLPTGSYFVEIVFLGYQTDTISNILINNDKVINIGKLYLKPQSIVLDGVQILASRPIIERQADKLIFNVENSTKSSGENLLDLMRSVPSVTVTGDDEIKVNGKSGVQVMVNGKVEQLNGEQLNNLLKSIQSSNVKKIEVSSNASAKFDANAKGGVINIVLKESMKSGVLGSVYTTYNQNKYSSIYTGFNLSVNFKKNTINTNYNYGYNKGFFKRVFDRNFNIDDVIQLIEEDGAAVSRNNNHYLNTNYRYSINDKQYFGLGVELFAMKNPNDGNSTLLTYNDKTTGFINEIQKTDNTLNNKIINPSVNANYKATLDSLGSSIGFSYDYTYFNSESFSNLVTNYYDNQYNQIADVYDFYQTSPYLVNLHTYKLDYNKYLKNENSLEFGIKFTWTKINNDIQFYNLVENNYQQDTTKSNEFRYTENINAAYGIWNKSWKNNWSTNVGLRVEQTNTNQYSITLNQKKQRHYVDFFPSVFVNKTIKENNNLNLSYTRKIQRPNFNDLNPFEFYMSPYSIWSGNADLKPQLIDVVEFTYTLKKYYSFFVGYEHVKNNYTHLAYQNDSTKITTYKATNFNVRNNLNIGVNINKELFKWWTMSFSATYTFFKYNTVISGADFNVSSNKGVFSLDNTFKLPKNFQINVFGFYATPFLDATDMMKSDGMVNVSITKLLLDKKLSIKLSGFDIFHTKNFSFDTNFFNVNSVTRNTFSSSAVALSISYNFQKGKQFQNTRVNKSNQEEKNRIQ